MFVFRRQQHLRDVRGLGPGEDVAFTVPAVGPSDAVSYPVMDWFEKGKGENYEKISIQ